MALGVSLHFRTTSRRCCRFKSRRASMKRGGAKFSRPSTAPWRTFPAPDGWEKVAITGTPSAEINEIAERWGATMLILGLGHHNRLDRIFGNETAIAVMRHARIPFVAVPATSRGLPEVALVAMDFTDASRAAANLAAQLVPQHGTLYVAHVCGFGGASAEPGDLIDLYRAGAKAKLDAVVAKLRHQADCSIESMLVEGEPPKRSSNSRSASGARSSHLAGTSRDSSIASCSVRFGRKSCAAQPARC
jgi:nucleotide-binding universal stress UspA family protein